MIGSIDIFISYKREERALAQRVAAALTEAGFVAVSDIDLARNEHFGDAIDGMIRKARMTVVLWTALSSRSEWVRMEARLARDLEKDDDAQNLYFGVLVQAADLPVDLRGLQMLDLTKTGLDDVGLGRLIAAVKEELGVPAQRLRAAAPEQSAALSEEFQLYDIACQIGAPEGFRRYLRAYPDGAFAKDAAEQVAAARTWWRRPFSRGKRAATIGFLTAGVAVAGLALEVSRPDAAAPEGFASVLQDRDEALAAKTRAERALEDLQTEVAELRADPSAAAPGGDALAEAIERAKAAEDAAERLDEERSRISERASAEINRLTGERDREAERADRLADEIALLKGAGDRTPVTPTGDRTPVTPVLGVVSPASTGGQAAAKDLRARFPIDFVDSDDAERLAAYQAFEEEMRSASFQERDEEAADLLRDLLSRPLSAFSDEMLRGRWRCRSIQASRGGVNGGSVFSYPFFTCRVTAGAVEGSYFFEKLSGSQRTSGFLYVEDAAAERLLYLGSATVNEDPQGVYGPGGAANEVAWAVRDGARSWQLRIFAPRGMEILELRR